MVGIIAEFNPLHKGHERLINFARENSNGCVVVLSSNFTQRGSPSIIDKFFRAESAINAGADLVIELPFLYSCSAAKDFARGAVEILGRSNFVDSIAFGMENVDFDVEKLIDVVLNENQDYKNFLRSELDTGASFPKANSIALEKILPGSFDFISKPNNMLALSYMAEIKKHDYKLKILKLKREGNFRSKDIREKILTSLSFTQPLCEGVIKMAYESGRISDENKLWPLLQNIFIRSNPQDLRKIYGIDEGIENLFLKHWRFSYDFNDFIGRCVCSRYTRAHIRRRLIYVLLNLNRDDVIENLKIKIPYARLLAFNQNGRKILKNHSDIKIITRLGKEKNFFSQTEFQASQLYELTLNLPNMSRETNTVIKF
ncbi:MAG: nucleotidyltransferase family protein [Synergistaceae bacterium]|nr:nucleotidyltransferase family protein [Synergistaceae bacterium]